MRYLLQSRRNGHLSGFLSDNFAALQRDLCRNEHELVYQIGRFNTPDGGAVRFRHSLLETLGRWHVRLLTAPFFAGDEKLTLSGERRAMPLPGDAPAQMGGC